MTFFNTKYSWVSVQRSREERFAKVANGFKPLTIIAKELRLRCLATIGHKIFEANSSFHVKWRTAGRV